MQSYLHDVFYRFYTLCRGSDGFETGAIPCEMATACQKVKLTTLPFEVRQLVYVHLFRTTTVYTNFASKYWRVPGSPERDVHQDLSIAFSTHEIRAESLPLFYTHALFDLTESCITFLTHGKPQIPWEVIKKLHRIRGSVELLLCLSDAPWPVRTLWPAGQISTLALEELSCDLCFNKEFIEFGRSRGNLPCKYNLVPVSAVHLWEATPFRSSAPSYLRLTSLRHHRYHPARSSHQSTKKLSIRFQDKH